MTSWTLRRSLGTSAALIAVGTLGLSAVGPAAHAAHAAAPQHSTRGHVTAPRASSHTFTFVSASSILDGKQSKQVGLFHGAIDGGGLDVEKGQSDVVHLPGGTIAIKHPNSQAKFHPELDKTTCYLTYKITGTFTLTGGTGRYRGVGGSGSYVGHGYDYLPRKKNGGCSMNAAPQSGVFSVSAKGTTH